MQIAQSLRLSLGRVNELPTSLLTRLVVGQQLEAVVTTPATIAELAKIKIEDSILQIRTPVPLAKGQTLLLEMVQENPTDKPVLKLILPAVSGATTDSKAKPLVEVANNKSNKPVTDTAQTVRETVTQKLSPTVSSSSADDIVVQLKPGQLLQATITEAVSAEQIVVVQPHPDKRLVTDQVTGGSIPRPSDNKPAQVKLPAIEIDVSALKTSFKSGQRVNIEVVSNQPLAVRLLPPDTLPLRHVIKQQQSSFITKLDSTEAPLTLKQVSYALRQVEQLPQALQQPLKQLFQHVAEKQVLYQPALLRQAINHSGVFLESHLRQQPETINQDFKANLLKLAQALEVVISKTSAQTASTKNTHIQSLPSEVRTALLRLIDSPEALQQSLAQISANIQQTGSMPSTLLNTLLSLLGRQIDNSPDNMKTLAKTLAVQVGKSAENVSSKVASNQQQANHNELQQLKDLLREVQSTAAKVQLNQLSMVKHADTQANNMVWLVDVPVRDKQQIDMMQLRVEQQYGHKGSKYPSEDTWQVQLNLETQTLGPLQVGINLYAETVKVVLNAALQQSADLLEQHIDLLQQRLAGLGLNVNQLSCHCVPIKPITPLSVLDEQDSSGAWVDMSV